VILALTRKNKLRRATLLALCALVFFFALHAKTAVYGARHSANITPSTAGKLWFSSQKMEPRAPSSAAVVLFWIGLLSLFGLYLHREPRMPNPFLMPAPRHRALRRLHRFLRPPPVL